MISKKIETAINKQINEELHSGQIYLSMAAYFERETFSGFANWAFIQYQGEGTHAKRFYDHIINRSGSVTLDKIAAPQTNWTSPINALKDSLAQERKLTGLIYNLVTLARAEKDYAADNMLQWFVNEQIEEEYDAETILKKLQFLDGSTSGMLALDRELAQRKFEE
jgi:ferritin